MRYFPTIEHINVVESQADAGLHRLGTGTGDATGAGRHPPVPGDLTNTTGEYRPFSSSELVEHGADTGFVAAVRGSDLGFGNGDLQWLGPADMVLWRSALVAGSSPGGMADRVADVPSARVDPRPSDTKPAPQRGPGLSAPLAVAALPLL